MPLIKWGWNLLLKPSEMEATFKHNLDVEERYFSLDIEALKNYDEGFRQAYDNGTEYEMSIKLSNIYAICPRKRQRKQLYERLVQFLAHKGLTLRITSRKHEKEKVINNQLSKEHYD